MISNGEGKVDDKVYPLFFICLCSQHAIYFQFLRPLIGSYFMLFTQVIKTVLKEQYPLVLQKWSTGDFSELTPLSWASEILVPFCFLYKQYILKRVSARKRRPSSIKSLGQVRVLNTWKWSPESLRTSFTWVLIPCDILAARSLSCVFLDTWLFLRVFCQIFVFVVFSLWSQCEAESCTGTPGRETSLYACFAPAAFSWCLLVASVQGQI